MNRLVRGSIMVVVAAVAWACSTDLGKDADVTDHLTATPSVVLVGNTDSATVDIEALNPQGGQLEGNFALSSAGAGLVVRQDTSFLPVAGGHSQTRARFVVRALDPTSFVSASFTVSANGKDIVIPVTITPVTIPANFSNPTPNVGDTITITAPTVLRFTPGTTSRASGGSAVVVAISADSLTASVVIGPGANASTIQFDAVAVTYIPGVLFDSVTTTGTVTTAPLSSFNLGINTFTPGIGAQLIVTIPAPFKFTDSSNVGIPSAPTLITNVSADSSTVTLLIGPNADSVLALDSLVVSGAPGLGRFTLGTAGVVTSPVLTAVAVGISDNTPNGGVPITVTAPAGFKFFPNLSFTVGGVPSLVESVAADSNSAIVIPQPGKVGIPILSNFGATGSPLALTLPATQTVTVGPSPFNNQDDPFGADFLPMPSSGNTSTFYDGGAYFDGTFAAGDSRYYRVHLTGAAVIDASLFWDNVADMGLYVLDAGFNTIIDAADNFGAQNKGPETATFTLPAGDYIFNVVKFGTGANVYRMRFTTQ